MMTVLECSQRFLRKQPLARKRRMSDFTKSYMTIFDNFTSVRYKYLNSLGTVWGCQQIGNDFRSGYPDQGQAIVLNRRYQYLQIDV